MPRPLNRLRKTSQDTPFRPSRPILTNDLVAIVDWCREYHKYGTMPQNADVRLHIAYYQIPQAVGWDACSSGAPCRHQGFMAAALHCIIGAEAQGVGIEGMLGHIFNRQEGIVDIRLIQPPEKDPGLLAAMLWMARASQQVVYGVHGGGSTRKSRFDPRHMGHCLGEAAHRLIAMCPAPDRAQAIHDEMQIMVGDLV